jgi:hypothetical protein
MSIGDLSSAGSFVTGAPVAITGKFEEVVLVCACIDPAKTVARTMEKIFFIDFNWKYKNISSNLFFQYRSQNKGFEPLFCELFNILKKFFIVFFQRNVMFQKQIVGGIAFR